MKKIKTKFLKILSIISCVVIISCSFIFTTSAATTYPYTGGTNHSIKNVNFDCQVIINFFQHNGDVMGSIIPYTYNVEYVDRGFILNVKCNIQETNNNHYWMIIRFVPTGGPATSNMNVTTGTVKIGMSATDFDIWQSNPYNTSAQPRAQTYYSFDGESKTGPVNGKLSYPNTSYTQYAQLDFAQNPDYTYLEEFAACVPFGTYNAVSEFNIVFYDYTFNTMSVAQGQTNQIIANQNAFYNEDIDFQDPHKIENPTPDNYAKSEDALLDATEQGRSESVSIFNRFGNLFADGHLSKVF